MRQIIEVPMDDIAKAARLFVEIDDANLAGTVPASATDDFVLRAEETLVESLARLRPAIEALAGCITKINSPDEASVEFGLKLGTKFGIVVASGDAEANLKVSLKWKKSALTGTDGSSSTLHG
jgi:hypothetical protein